MFIPFPGNSLRRGAGLGKRRHLHQPLPSPVPSPRLFPARGTKHQDQATAAEVHCHPGEGLGVHRCPTQEFFPPIRKLGYKKRSHHILTPVFLVLLSTLPMMRVFSKISRHRHPRTPSTLYVYRLRFVHSWLESWSIVPVVPVYHRLSKLHKLHKFSSNAAVCFMRCTFLTRPTGHKRHQGS